MQAVKRIRKRIQSDPGSEPSKTFAALVLSLESGQPFDLSRLYELSYDDFHEAVKLIQEWRLERYYSAKFRLLDLSAQMVGTGASAGPSER